MTPEEITALQDENVRLRGENEGLKQLLVDARQRIEVFAGGIDAIRRIARQGIEEIERIESER